MRSRREIVTREPRGARDSRVERFKKRPVEPDNFGSLSGRVTATLALEGFLYPQQQRRIRCRAIFLASWVAVIVRSFPEGEDFRPGRGRVTPVVAALLCCTIFFSSSRALSLSLQLSRGQREIYPRAKRTAGLRTRAMVGGLTKGRFDSRCADPQNLFSRCVNRER